MNKWLVRKGGDEYKFRLFCFTYAGGSASVYRSWQAGFDSRIEVCAVQLPGRGARMMEPPYVDVAALMQDLAPIIAAEGNLPFAFFGHSLGAIVAFELARFCFSNYYPMPVRIFVSGCNAPQAKNPSKALHLMRDDELIEELKMYNGMSPQILANKEVMKFFLPMIRADFSMAEKYEYKHGEILPVKIIVLAGRDDNLTSVGQMEAWQLESQDKVRLEWFEGGHLFINDESMKVPRYVNTELLPLVENSR